MALAGQAVFAPANLGCGLALKKKTIIQLSLYKIDVETLEEFRSPFTETTPKAAANIGNP